MFYRTVKAGQFENHAQQTNARCFQSAEQYFVVWKAVQFLFSDNDTSSSIMLAAVLVCVILEIVILVTMKYYPFEA